MDKNIIFYAFSQKNQSLNKNIKCNIEGAIELFDTESEKMENGKSDFDYIDITSEKTGGLYRKKYAEIK